MKRKKILSLHDICDNLRVYLVGEKENWMKHYNFDNPAHFLEVFGFEYEPNFYPDDCPCYTVNKEGNGYTISYSYDGCTVYNAEIDDIHFTKSQVLDFFSKKDIEYIEN
jgi:hypothetical protein